jgi:phenylalanyl-tRNA synthetase beta chain
MEVSRNWLQTYFKKKLPEADVLVDLFNSYAFEVEGLRHVGDDAIIDIDVLPNRSSDCLSHRGVAKEVGTLLGIPLLHDPLRESIPAWSEPKNLTVTVTDEVLCPRYMGSVVYGVTVGPSPEWLKSALASIGQKSVNNIVDATNYVMFNLGQPVHAFDMAKLQHDKNGVYAIAVRLAKEGERITTLTNDSYTLKETHQVITDAVSDEPIALAGIKGGKVAEVDEGTTNIIVEVANFNPVLVRKTAHDLKLQTDASLRFQNELSPRLPAFGMRAVLKLITDIANGTEAGVTDVYTRQSKNEPIVVSQNEINALLGLSLTHEDIESILVRLEWDFSRHENMFTVTGPWERTDITIKETVVEEIGRIYGYKNITSIMPAVPDDSVCINKNHYYTELIQQKCAELGYSEVLTYTIVDKGDIELENPFASDKAFMRKSLSHGMNEALKLNARHAPLLGLDAIKLFEIGTVFTKRGERLSFCAGVHALNQKQSKLEKILAEDIQTVLTTIGTKASVQVKNGIVEIDLESIFPLLPKSKNYGASIPWNTEARFKQWSAYPYVLRDIAIWVPESTTDDTVFAIIEKHASDLLVRADLFDTFKKDGRISYAWHLVFQSDKKTLTDEEIHTIMDTITRELNAQKNWEVR